MRSTHPPPELCRRHTEGTTTVLPKEGKTREAEIITDLRDATVGIEQVVSDVCFGILTHPLHGGLPTDLTADLRQIVG